MAATVSPQLHRGYIMSRKKDKTQIKGGFFIVPHVILKSPAWLSCGLAARSVWLLLMMRTNGKNNGMISLSCREAAEHCNISKNTAARAFDELIERGLIHIAKDSGFDYKQKKARLWRITHLKDDRNGHASTDEWKRYKPQEKTRSRKRDTSVLSEIQNSPDFDL